MNTLALTLLAQVVVTAPPPHTVAPFAVGESFTYKARSSALIIPITAGKATLSVLGIDTIRGVPSWHFGMDMSVSILGVYTNQTEMRSWTGIGDFISRRFTKHLVENGRVLSNDDFKIYPDSLFFRNKSDTITHPTPAAPIDDVAFIYYVRKMPLKIGGVYSYPLYFRKEIGDVRVTVLRRELMKLPDGTTVDCLVLNPVVEERNGMFRKEADARLWLTDDARRIPVRIEAKYSFGTVRLELDRMVFPKP